VAARSSRPACDKEQADHGDMEMSGQGRGLCAAGGRRVGWSGELIVGDTWTTAGAWCWEAAGICEAMRSVSAWRSRIT